MVAKLGIIDIGSNSMRLVVLQIRPDGSFKVIDEVKESARLGDKSSGVDRLSPEKINAAFDTLQLFKDLCDALDVQDVICVATEAVRRAGNKSDLLAIVKEKLGIDIRVLSGTEEAYYDYLGAVNSLDLPDCMLMDIGGNSTEIVAVKGGQIENSISFPFGAMNLSQKFHLEDTIRERTKKSLHEYLGEQFKKIDWLKRDCPLIGIGGSFRNLAKIDRKLKNYPLDTAHNYPLSTDSLLNIYEMVGKLSADERKGIMGLSKDRVDIFPGALAEIVVLYELTGFTGIITSGSGLREGLFYEWMYKDELPVEDVLEFSLQNIIKNYEVNQNHARNVWKIALGLYLALQDELNIDKNQERVLKTAALLHDCGISTNYYDHHKHSFYKILNSRINGLTHKELVMAAWTAALHRKDEMKITAPYRTILSSNEIMTVQKLGILLRIAESLDRRQNGNVKEVQSLVDKNSVRINITARINPRLEIKDAQSVAQSFRKVFRRQLVIEDTGNGLKI